ncbi:MAG: metallophosphoesterase family protein [Jannaschia sp.]
MSLANPDRIAVIADIHGNADALSAVLADIGDRAVDLIVNLGDHVSGPLVAAETMALIRATPMVSIRGNHDRWMADLSPDEMGASDRAAFDDLSEEDIGWLRALPPAATLGDDIFACHATPQDDLTYWLQTVRPDGQVTTRDPVEVAARAVPPHGILLCGHTHICGAVTLPDGRRIVNPGSVGLPAYDDTEPFPHVMEAGSPEARYALLTRTEAGWDVTFLAVPYDTTRMARFARARGREEWATAIETGRLPR